MIPLSCRSNLAGRYLEPRIESQPGGLVRQPYLLHRLTRVNRFLGSLNVYKYGLRLHWLAELVPWNRFLGSITWRTKTTWIQFVFFASILPISWISRVCFASIFLSSWINRLRFDLSNLWNKQSLLRFDLSNLWNKQSSFRFDLSNLWNKQNSLRFNLSKVKNK